MRSNTTRRLAGAGGATAEAKGPEICGFMGRGVCLAIVKGGSCLIRIAGVFCSTAGGAGTVKDRSKGAAVARTVSGGSGY